MSFSKAQVRARDHMFNMRSNTQHWIERGKLFIAAVKEIVNRFRERAHSPIDCILGARESCGDFVHIEPLLKKQVTISTAGH